mgnify:CR=1 FL=1
MNAGSGWIGVLVAVFSLQSGCALTSKADALSPRYFSPEQATRQGPPVAMGSLELRLGQVTSATHIDERISYRLSGSEVGFYDDRRWTELPEAYLRRALEHELFEQRGLQRIVTGAGPSLDVELTAFEELRGKPTRARVTLTFSLRDERRSLLEKSLRLEREVTAQAGADPEQSLAATLSAALADAVASVGTQVVSLLQSQKQVSASEVSATPQIPE